MEKQWKEELVRLMKDRDIVTNTDDFTYYDGMIEGMYLAASLLGYDSLLEYRPDIYEKQIQERVSGGVPEQIGTDSSDTVDGEPDSL
jgi:hypothetical protein